MDAELEKKLAEQDKKLENILIGVNKIRKYFLVIIWITIIAVVLPLIGLIFAVPVFMRSYMSAFEGLI